LGRRKAGSDKKEETVTAEVLDKLIVIFATISVGRVAERAKELEAERDKGLLGLGRSKE
jgi:hypothetical protein